VSIAIAWLLVKIRESSFEKLFVFGEFIPHLIVKICFFEKSFTSSSPQVARGAEAQCLSMFCYITKKLFCYHSAYTYRT
jgi:hypothetical protein